MDVYTNNGNYSIKVAPILLKSFNFKDAIHSACNSLSNIGISNYAHFYDDGTIIELIDLKIKFRPVIRYISNTIELLQSHIVPDDNI